MLNDCLEFHLVCVMSHLVQSRAGPCVCVCVWGGGGGIGSYHGDTLRYLSEIQFSKIS